MQATISNNIYSFFFLCRRAPPGALLIGLLMLATPVPLLADALSELPANWQEQSSSQSRNLTFLEPNRPLARPLPRPARGWPNC